MGRLRIARIMKEPPFAASDDSKADGQLAAQFRTDDARLS
jgi:hypothetical protein